MYFNKSTVKKELEKGKRENAVVVENRSVTGSFKPVRGIKVYCNIVGLYIKLFKT